MLQHPFCVSTDVLLQSVPKPVRVTLIVINVNIFALLDFRSQTLVILECSADSVFLVGVVILSQGGTINSYIFDQARIKEEHQLTQCPPYLFQMIDKIFGTALSLYIENYKLKTRACDIREDILFLADTITSLKNNFHIADVPKSVCNKATAVQIFREMISLLASEGFR